MKKQALIRVQKPTPEQFLCIVSLIFDLFDPKINGFSRLVVKRFYVKFGDRCRGV